MPVRRRRDRRSAAGRAGHAPAVPLRFGVRRGRFLVRRQRRRGESDVRARWRVSALKMAYAAWTKGTTALVLAIRARARAEAVEEALREEWLISQPDLLSRSAAAAQSAAAKSWRWVGEMEEI